MFVEEQTDCNECADKSLNLLDEIINNLKLMQKRPGMYFSKYPDYDIATSFIEGYLCAFASRYLLAFGKLHGRNIYDDPTYWYIENANNSSCSNSLSHYIRVDYKNLNNEELIQQYISTLVGFFESKRVQDECTP